MKSFSDYLLFWLAEAAATILIGVSILAAVFAVALLAAWGDSRKVRRRRK